MTNNANTYNGLIKAIGIASLAVVMLWLLHKVLFVVLVFIFAMIISLVIIAPVGWLEKKGMKRGLASALVFGIIIICFGLLGWLVIPKIYQQLHHLVSNLPQYINSLSETVGGWLQEYPEISSGIKEEGSNFINWLPPAPQLIRQVSNYSLSVAGFLFLVILFSCIVVYTVSRPRPLVKIYYSFFPESKTDKAENALVKTSKMLSGWIKANLIAGSIDAVAVTTFLTIMNVPGAWVWGALALFAELIPNLGFYIMMVPPVLVALSVSPITALWVLIFFIVLSEVMSNVVMPRLISNHMNIHPVSTLFMLLVMGSAFGIVGALLTVPVTAIIKAFYEEFFGKVKDTKALEMRVDHVLYREN